ncbi:DUF6492 family protein [Agrococcus sp. ProA11]|uniref:DUF6492 family protein n=1 Tax=Agrococcus chionoecetis TaxID=3153752 RepID=UPI00326088DD
MTAAPRALTFVTVVFEPEIPLLRLQARSLARFLDEAAVAEIIVLDNCAGGMPGRTRRRVLAEFGPILAPRVTFLRTAELGVRGSTAGWRSQQAAKLLIARRIGTSHYVILDAKNHLVAPGAASDFVDATGTARGGTHPYTEHPLRSDLERTLRFLGADDAAVARAIEDFPTTITPFVIDTALALRMIDDVEATAGEPFATAFERARLLEFFLYSGWSIRREQRVPVNGAAIRAPIIWPGRATEQGARDAIRERDDADARWFSVHRRVLVRADAATRRHIIAFWTERELMSAAEARAFVRRFRRSYVPAVARARIAERLSVLGGR